MANEHPYPFRMLCMADRRALYEPILSGLPYRLEMFDDTDDLLRKCIIEPPCAIMADFLTLTRQGHEKSAPLFDLNVCWPVVRCNVNAEGKAMAMCYEPARREPLSDAMSAIAAGDPTWAHPRFRRQHLRIDWSCRVRLYGTGGAWHPGNTLNLSAGGLFVVTYETLVANQQIDLTLRDLEADDLTLHGAVAQVKTWASSSELPGLGLRLIGGDVDRYRQALTRPELISQFRRSIH